MFDEFDLENFDLGDLDGEFDIGTLGEIDIGDDIDLDNDFLGSVRAPKYHFSYGRPCINHYLANYN